MATSHETDSNLSRYHQIDIEKRLCLCVQAGDYSETTNWFVINFHQSVNGIVFHSRKLRQHTVGVARLPGATLSTMAKLLASGSRAFSRFTKIYQRISSRYSSTSGDSRIDAGVPYENTLKVRAVGIHIAKQPLSAKSSVASL